MRGTAFAVIGGTLEQVDRSGQPIASMATVVAAVVLIVVLAAVWMIGRRR